jgi:hypothetical protein
MLYLKKGFPRALSIDADYVSTWTKLTTWKPVVVHGNWQMPNYLFVETVDSIVIIGILNLKAFFVNYIPLDSRIDDVGWSRAVAVNS